jgi:hypothetical protein
MRGAMVRDYERGIFYDQRNVLRKEWRMGEIMEDSVLANGDVRPTILSFECILQ